MPETAIDQEADVILKGEHVLLLSGPVNKRKSESPLAARISLGIVATIALSIPLGIALKETADLTLLQHTLNVTDATVIKKSCENHGKLAYSYAVEGKAYRGSGTLPGRSCDDVTVGESIEIMYSTEKPQLSRSDSLASWQSTIHGNLFGLFLIAIAAAVVIFHITRIDDES